MALFGKKKKAEESVKDEKQKEVVDNKTTPTSLVSEKKFVRDYTHVLRRPRITEKATFAVENGVYVFEIDPRSTKHDVMHAVEEFYKVKPKKVNITQIPSKKVSSRKRGVFGRKGGGKKAYVYLNDGDTINIV